MNEEDVRTVLLNPSTGISGNSKDRLNKAYSPSSKNTGRFRQESTGNHRNVEAAFPSEIFRIFSDDFRPVPAGKHGN
jgi:hypothetical protein